MSNYIDRALILVYIIGVTSIEVIPLVMALTSLIKPCMPSLISASLPACSTNSKFNYHPLVYIVSFLMEIGTWYVMACTVLYAQILSVMYPASIMNLSINLISR